MSEKKTNRYLADLNRVAEESSQTGVFLMPGEIVLQTAQWNILHDQLVRLTTYHRFKAQTQSEWLNRRHASIGKRLTFFLADALVPDDVFVEERLQDFDLP